MIGKLTGVVSLIEDSTLILDTKGGVGYVVSCPKYVMEAIIINEEISIYIQTIVREDDIILYGFKTISEKKVFNILITVQGVGAKVALAILSFIDIEDLEKAIVFEDINKLKTVPGVGVKVAQRIITELKDKISNAFESNRFKKGETKLVNNYNSSLDEVNSILKNLGYQSKEIESVLVELDETILQKSSEEIIKEALRLFVKGK